MSSDILDEILAGAGGDPDADKTEAINTLTEWSTWLATLIQIVISFFSKLGIKLG